MRSIACAEHSAYFFQPFAIFRMRLFRSFAKYVLQLGDRPLTSLFGGIPTLLTAIRQAQSVLDHSQQQNLRQLVVANLDICVQSPEMRQEAEALILDTSRDLSELNVQNSFDVLQLLTVQELLQCTYP
jgi:hypothetical protein